MRTKIILLASFGLLGLGCGVPSPLNQNPTTYEHCEVRYNFCIQYPRAVFPAPEEGDNAENLVLGLYSEENDIRLLVSADKNAEGLSFEQLYQLQMDNWKGTYDDVSESGSQITDTAFEVSATGEGYYLYTKTVALHPGEDLVSMRLVAGPELSPAFFEEIKESILIFPNR